MVNLVNFLLEQQPLKSLYCTSSSELDLGSNNEKKDWSDVSYLSWARGTGNSGSTFGLTCCTEHQESSSWVMTSEPNQRQTDGEGRQAVEKEGREQKHRGMKRLDMSGELRAGWDEERASSVSERGNRKCSWRDKQAKRGERAASLPARLSSEGEPLKDVK